MSELEWEEIDVDTTELTAEQLRERVAELERDGWKPVQPADYNNRYEALCFRRLCSTSAAAVVRAHDL